MAFCTVPSKQQEQQTANMMTDEYCKACESWKGMFGDSFDWRGDLEDTQPNLVDADIGEMAAAWMNVLQGKFPHLFTADAEERHRNVKFIEDEQGDEEPYLMDTVFYLLSETNYDYAQDRRMPAWLPEPLRAAGAAVARALVNGKPDDYIRLMQLDALSCVSDAVWTPDELNLLYRQNPSRFVRMPEDGEFLLPGCGTVKPATLHLQGLAEASKEMNHLAKTVTTLLDAGNPPSQSLAQLWRAQHNCAISTVTA